MQKPKYTQPKPCGAATRDISEFAERIGKALSMHPGCDIERIVTRLNGSIKYLSPSSLTDSRKASITVEKGGKFIIRLFSVLFPLQKRLSIAHELGHLFLHSRYGKVPLEAFHDTQNEDDQVEDEAHEFACAFLMPARMVRQAVKILGNDSIKVAATFMVPEPIARQRINDVRC